MNQPINAKTARHVLWHYGCKGGYEPGNFTKNLMRTVDSADRVNTEMLRTAYPALVAAMFMAGNDMDGIAKLRAIAEADGVAVGEPPVPQCPEALINPETGDLLRCVQRGRHDWHETPGGTQWRVPVDSSAEVPF